VTSVDANRIWSEEAGPVDAPLVVVIHGSMDRSAGLLKLSLRLDTDVRVLRYDRRGYGRSTPHDGPFGMDAQVADVVTLLDGEPAVVFGHSYGGNVALALATRHPELVRAVGVYEAPLSWLDWWPGTTAGANALATRGDPAEAAERFMRRLIGDQRWARLPPRTRAARRAEGIAMVGELTDLRQGPPWDASAITVPTLAVHGTDGAPHHTAATRYLGQVLPDCRVVEIPGARHFGPNTHPDAVAAAIRELLKGCADRSSG
jgi:pimeloyl-ACP methyl ester carboxylesterase